MSRLPAVEFVCYEEGGVINLQRALDDLLVPSLEQVLSLPVEEEASTPAVQSFQPALRPLTLHRAPEEVLPPSYLRDEPLKYEPVVEQTRPSLDLSLPTLERVYPFKRATEPSPPQQQEVSKTTIEAPECRVEPSAKPTDLLPQRIERVQPAPRVIEPPRSLAPERLSRKPELEKRVTTPTESVRAFHDLLATRSQERKESRQSRLLLKLANWQSTLIPVLGVVALLAGGVAIGAGIMSVTRGGAMGGGAGVVIGVSVATVGVTLMIRKASKPRGKTRVVAVRA